MNQISRMFVKHFGIFVVVGITCSFVLGGISESLIQPRDCDLIEPDFDGSLDEKINACEKSNKVIESSKYFHYIIRVMFFLPAIAYAISMHIIIPINKIFDDEYVGSLPP